MKTFMDYGITTQEYFSDKELREAVLNVMRQLETYTHMGMEWRVKKELDKRAQCGGMNEENTLAHADLRNRLMLEHDLKTL